VSLGVRPLEAADRAAWAALWEGYLAFYGTARPAAQYDLHFARLLDPADDCWHGLVAQGPDGLSGLAHVLIHPHGWQPRPTAYLQDLFVAPQGRRTGLGRALMDAVYALADRLDAQGVYWTTQGDNTDARRLYDRVGTRTPFIKYARA
jgi:GNAT superfamily N-acetyltransferase